MSRVSVGIDVGGTFTDLVAVNAEGTITAGKVLSTPDDQSNGVEHALTAFTPNAADVDRIVHGTTVVTNMLLERTGARVVLCATRGASDLLELRRQERAALYDLAAHHPAPLVPSERVVDVDERIAPEGVLRPLSNAEAARVAEQVAALDADIVAIALLHAYADPAHEERLAAALATRLPSIDIATSSAVLPEIREYERTSTTACEAYVRPGAGRYIGRLASRLAERRYPAPTVMSSGGGTIRADRASAHSASLALSGPAGGVAGAALVARAAGFDRALSIDIGGTSADVGLILNGEPLIEAGGVVAGVPIALPRVLVETVSAGGGSLAWIDNGGALRVGPRSAGARPGPVAFRRGGTQPTVTDAHIALGNIRATHMSDGVELDIAAARAAIDALAVRLGATSERTAAAIVAGADASMARALRRVSVERGIDPRTCVLLAFGGGGPLHACGLAERLGMRAVLIPPHAGVLSALGLAVAPERRIGLASVMADARTLVATDLAALFDKLERATLDHGLAVATTTGHLRARYRGQGHELDTPVAPGMGGDAIVARFAALHQERYGFTLDRPVEVVSARGTWSSRAHDVALERRGTPSWDAAMHDRGAPLDVTVRGRATVVLSDATMLVDAGWTARALPLGGWLLERDA